MFLYFFYMLNTKKKNIFPNFVDNGGSLGEVFFTKPLKSKL